VSSVRIKVAAPSQMLVGGWSYSTDRPRLRERNVWITAAADGTVASLKATIDLDDTTVTLRIVDERLKVLHFPTETVRHDIPHKDLFVEADRLLLEAAFEQMRAVAATTVEEVSDRG
jgi:hypothetical protein